MKTLRNLFALALVMLCTMNVSAGKKVLLSANFDDGSVVINGWGNNQTRDIVDGAFHVNNPSVVSSWESQIAYDFNDPFLPNNEYTLTMKIRGSAAGQITFDLQNADNNYVFVGEFGTIDFDEDWKDVKVNCICNGEGGRRLIASIGQFEGDIYIDDFEFSVRTDDESNNTYPKTWDFTQGFSEETLAGLENDSWYWGCWYAESETRYTLQCDKSMLTYYGVNGKEETLKETSGLLFVGGNSGNIHIDHGLNTPCIKFNSTTPTVTIPELTNGMEITIVTKTGNKSSERGIACISGNATRISGAEASLEEITNVFEVTCEEGTTTDVTFQPYNGGINIYSIAVDDITTIEQAVEKLLAVREEVVSYADILGDSLGFAGLKGELMVAYELTTSVDETSIEAIKAEIVRLDGILMKIDEGKSIYAKLPVLIEECEILLDGKPWEKMTESLASVKSLMDNPANVNTDEFVSAYETLKNIKSSLSLLNTFVSRTDVDILLTNDEKYPWKILDGYLQNGNTGIDYSASSLTIAYSSVYKTEISFDWLCRDYYDNNLSVFIDGVSKSSTTNSSYTNQRFYLEPGEHLIMFQDTIRDTYSTYDYSYIKNLSIKEIKPLEKVALSANSDSITFDNNEVYPWTIEDGYIQSSNYGYANTTSKFSTTFTVEEPSKFSFDLCVNSDYRQTNYFGVDINGERFYTYRNDNWSSNYSTGWMKKNVLLDPGKYTIEFLDSVCNSNTDNYSRIRNIELSSNWVEVELASAGTLGVEVLYKVNVLNDVELLKVKGTLNGTDWTNIKQMKNLLGLDLSEAKFDALPGYAFDGLSWLSNVKLPEGMTSIGEYAFCGTQIWDIDIPSTVTYIGQYAFANTRLRSIDFPENSQLETIGYSAFYQCSSLKEFIMPNTVTTLQRYNNSSNTGYECNTFRKCTSLKKLHFSDALSVLNYSVCYDCTNLSDLHLPANLKNIYNYAFGNNNKLVKVNFPETLTSIGYAAFINCALDSVKLPVKLSSLGEDAFQNCDNLKYIELPSYIGNYDDNFYDCDAIQKIVSRSATPPAIYEDPFREGRSKSAITLVVPSFAVVNYKLDTYWYQFGSIVEGDDIDYWKITSDLSLTNNRRMNGKPDVDLYYGGRFTVGGNAPMEVGQLNYYVNESNPGRLLNTCADFTADSLNTYYSVDANKWYFFTPIHDVDLSKVTHSANASFVFRYYNGESRATNGSGNSWRNVDTGNLFAGQGYIFQCNASGIVTMPADVTEHAKMFNTEDVTLSLAAYEAAASANQSWNYVGNPYPCYYDIYYMDFTAPVTVWTGSTYKAYSIVDDNLVLRPMQSFFVQKPDAVDNIIFHKEGRQLSSSVDRATYAMAYSRSAATRHFFELQIMDDEQMDETRVVVNNQSSLGYEIACDASKFMSFENTVPQILTLDANGVGYAINERPLENGTVKVGYYAGKSGFLTISTVRADGEIILHDHVLNKTANLAEQDYTFHTNVTEGTDTERFTLSLNVKDNGATGVDGLETKVKTSVVGQNGALSVLAAEGSAISIYAADGRLVYSEKATGMATEIALSPGMYVVKVNETTLKAVVY